jgi:hypothetical protein
MTDQDRLDRIAAAADAATEGPWDGAEMRRRPGRWAVWDREGSACIAEVFGERDAEFIVTTRTDVPWLLSVVREQADQVARLDAAMHEWEASAESWRQKANEAADQIERLNDLVAEFRKRGESQDRIRERLTAERDRLRATIADIRADNEDHARTYGPEDQRFRDGMSHALAKFMLADSLAALPAQPAAEEEQHCEHDFDRPHWVSNPVFGSCGVGAWCSGPAPSSPVETETQA